MGIGLIGFIVIGLAAGWVAGQLMKTEGCSMGGDLMIGVISALLGGVLVRELCMSPGSGLLGSLIIATLIVATIGGIGVLFLLRQFKKA
jgi:uncharacterized membrane protein YeaQ/YmgE (transglycosylase-associated protein family)